MTHLSSLVMPPEAGEQKRPCAARRPVQSQQIGNAGPHAPNGSTENTNGGVLDGRGQAAMQRRLRGTRVRTAKAWVGTGIDSPLHSSHAPGGRRAEASVRRQNTRAVAANWLCRSACSLWSHSTGARREADATAFTIPKQDESFAVRATVAQRQETQRLPQRLPAHVGLEVRQISVLHSESRRVSAQQVRHVRQCPEGHGGGHIWQLRSLCRHHRRNARRWRAGRNATAIARHPNSRGKGVGLYWH